MRLPEGRVALPARRSAAEAAGPDYGVSDDPDWRDVAWDGVVRDVEVRGARMHYVDMGTDDEKPPLLLVHGVAGCWQHWLENIAPLARGRRVLAVDLPGFGRSEPMGVELSMTEYALTLDAFCEVLDTGPVVAIGNSMGGYVCAALAVRRPSRVERLVLVDPACLSITRGSQLHLRGFVRLLSALGTSGTLAERRMLRRPGFRHLMLGGMVRHPTRIEMDVICEQLDGTGAPAFRQSMAALRECDFSPSLQQIACQTLIIFGRDDVLVPVRDAAELGELVPDSRVLVLDDTGHMPMLERPRRFNSEVAAFLSSTRQGETALAAG